MIYQKESLNALLLFFSENIPHPRQSDKKTKKIFRQLRRVLYREISANLAGRRKEYAKMYLVYLTCRLRSAHGAFVKLKDISLKDVLAALPDPVLEASQNEKRNDSDGSTFREEGDFPEVVEKFVSTVRIYMGYMSTVDKVLDFATSCRMAAQKSRRSYPEKDGLSGKLVRKQENFFWNSLHHEPIADVPQEIKHLKFKKQLIPATAANLGLEIEQNLKNFGKDITTPYLKLLQEHLSHELELLKDLPMPPFSFPEEFDETEMQKWSDRGELHWLLSDVHRVRFARLQDICDNIREQLATDGHSEFPIRWGEPLDSKHLFFLRMIMSGTASYIIEDDRYRDPSKLPGIFLEISASKVLKKIKRLQNPENWTEQEREDFYRIQREVEATSIARKERHKDSYPPDAVPEAVNALEEVDKFLKLWEERESHGCAEVASPAL